MTERTIKIEKVGDRYGFTIDPILHKRSPDNLDLYTLTFQLRNLEGGFATESGVAILKKFAKKYRTKVVIHCPKVVGRGRR